MMNNFNQLKLFSSELPKWKDITIEWLYNYLNSLYPEMKFKLIEEEDYDGNKDFCIKQTAFKKVKLEFSLGEFCSSVDFCKNRNFISCSTQQEFGSWCGMSEPIDNMEYFKKILPIRIQHCKNSAMEYKNRKKKINEEEEC